MNKAEYSRWRKTHLSVKQDPLGYCMPGYKCLCCPYSDCIAASNYMRSGTPEEHAMMMMSGMDHIWRMAQNHNREWRRTNGE